MIEIFEKKLDILNPEILNIVNQSDQHIGHSGYSNGNSHFEIFIVSSQFNNLSKVKRHKLIYNVLKYELETQIHALSIKALTPLEYNKL